MSKELQKVLDKIKIVKLDDLDLEAFESKNPVKKNENGEEQDDTNEIERLWTSTGTKHEDCGAGEAIDVKDAGVGASSLKMYTLEGVIVVCDGPVYTTADVTTSVGASTTACTNAAVVIKKGASVKRKKKSMNSETESRCTL